MARWRLTQPHYLNVPGTEWEYTENDRKTGKPKRHKFPVGLYLDPASPGDWNHQLPGEDGEIIVTQTQDNAHPNDYIFTGQPTPDMLPLDDEAREISASYADQWKHPIDTLPGNGGFSQSILDGLNVKLSEAAAASSTAVVAAQAEGMKEVLASMASMMKQNQDLIAMLAQARVPESARRG